MARSSTLRWAPALLMMALPASASAQAEEDGFGQWLYTSMKVASAIGKWRVYGDFQLRLNENWREMEQWMVESGLTYMPNANWELTPDFRVTVRPSHIEYRPGAGVIFKISPPTWQIALQHKYQLDIESTGIAKHGFRQSLFVNHLVSNRVIASVLGGWFYRSEPDFTGVQFWRGGGGISYIFDPLHTVSLSYFLGWQNLGDRWITEGFAFVGFTFNIRTDWRYVPAQVISF